MSMVRTDAKTSAPVLVIAWVVALATFGYMLPWAVAASRGKSNAGAIGVINLLLGWTLIGWIIALVMACGSHQVVGTMADYRHEQAPTVWTDPATGHVLTMNPATGQPMRIDPVTGLPWVEPIA